MTAGGNNIAEFSAEGKETGKEPGPQAAGKKKPKTSRRTQPKRSAEAPLSRKGAYAIYEVKTALVRDALAARDAAWEVYDVLSCKAEGEDG